VIYITGEFHERATIQDSYDAGNLVLLAFGRLQAARQG
jgi:hypothetical protein